MISSFFKPNNLLLGVDPPPGDDPSDTAGPSKRGVSDTKENTSPKKKRPKTSDISLPNAPKDGKNDDCAYYPF